ncbi:MAG: hypothetical protein JTJ14_00100 [Lactococcus lactis]|nr:hypothetical protein [Enterococcus sp.]MBN2936292.1 hypothetical protein [Lactococcus lactis]
MRVTFFVFRKNKKPPSKKLKATQNKRFHGSMALSPSTMLQTQFSKKNDYQPIQLFQQSVQKMKKIVAEKLSRDRRKIFDQRRNQQPQEFLFLSFASIVTCPHVTDFWV